MLVSVSSLRLRSRRHQRQARRSTRRRRRPRRSNRHLGGCGERKSPPRGPAESGRFGPLSKKCLWRARQASKMKCMSASIRRPSSNPSSISMASFLSLPGEEHRPRAELHRRLTLGRDSSRTSRSYQSPVEGTRHQKHGQQSKFSGGAYQWYTE